ncbi:hypothetical protein BCON_0046g00010 [Botryotinia convoluta]|uniref:Uncharacterized protein n=1 Tax=Botryotinia convoluta TaxID=54673 RepID=A0A4Z1ICU9_9HELO|nr:hypothetical protein BCON_0046g00010 [Botryotinia convoluta]
METTTNYNGSARDHDNDSTRSMYLTMTDFRAMAAPPLSNLDFGPSPPYVLRENMTEGSEDPLLAPGHIYSDPAPSYTFHLRHGEVLLY